MTVFYKLFNGISIFSKYNIEIGSIILDDVHSCIYNTRDKFTVNIKNSSELYYTMNKIFDVSLYQQTLMILNFAHIN